MRKSIVFTEFCNIAFVYVGNASQRLFRVIPGKKPSELEPVAAARMPAASAQEGGTGLIKWEVRGLVLPSGATQVRTGRFPVVGERVIF